MTNNGECNVIDIREATEILLSASNIVLTTHVNPDGDALGSEGGLYYYLTRKGKTVRIINASPVPANLAILGEAGIFETYSAEAHDAILRNADLIAVLDVNALSRLDTMQEAVAASGGNILVIDHHTEPQPFAGYYLTNTEVCATGELVYDIIANDGSISLDRNIALQLYVAIVTDTGSFRFERTTPKVHRIAAKLLETGLFPPEIHERVYDAFKMNRTRLLGMALESITPAAGGKATIMTILRKMFEETGTTYEDTEGMVNFGLSIDGVSATAMITELDDCVKVSLRSRGNVHIHSIAKSLGGGGHLYAAGARIPGDGFEAIRSQVEAAFEDLFSVI